MWICTKQQWCFLKEYSTIEKMFQSKLMYSRGKNLPCTLRRVMVQRFRHWKYSVTLELGCLLTWISGRGTIESAKWNISDCELSEQLFSIAWLSWLALHFLYTKVKKVKRKHWNTHWKISSSIQKTCPCFQYTSSSWSLRLSFLLLQRSVKVNQSSSSYS